MEDNNTTFPQQMLDLLGIPAVILRHVRADSAFFNSWTKIAVQIAISSIFPMVIITDEKSRIISVGRSNESLAVAFEKAMKSTSDKFILIANRRIDEYTAEQILDHFDGGIIIAPEIDLTIKARFGETYFPYRFSNFTLLKLLFTDIKKENGFNKIIIDSINGPDEIILECFEFIWPIIVKIDRCIIFFVRNRTLGIWRENQKFLAELLSDKEKWEKPIVAASNIKLTYEDINIIHKLGVSALIQPIESINPDVINAAGDTGLVLCSLNQ